MKRRTIYKPLNTTARILGLPMPYLRELAEKRTIPVLDVNGRLRFNLEAVQNALDEIAAQEGGKDAG